MKPGGDFFYDPVVHGPLLADRPLRNDERLVARNRRLRRLLVDVLWYLDRPGRPGVELSRRTQLATRIRAEVEE